MDNILDFLEQTAETHRHRMAVDDGSICLSWGELLELSQRMGSYFAKKTEAGKPIAICMEKSALALAAMLGAVYAGCFYVVVDAGQPVARLRRLLGVLKPAVVFSDKEQQDIMRQVGVEKELCFPSEAIKEEINAGLLASVRMEMDSSDILYGIFTSGSTGVPKAVVVSHRAVIDFIGHFMELFGFTENDRIGNQAPFDFDVSVKDIYTSVMTGATLILIPKTMFAVPRALLDHLCEKKVTVLIWAVSALTLVSALKGLKYRVPEAVRYVLFSGEVMPTKQLRLWQEALPEAKFVNLYGPSEITCNCTYYPIHRIFEEGEKLPIGRAFPGREVFLLDEERQRIQAAGQQGEICVSGESLALGYYRNQEETRRRFVIGDTGERYYRTGDIGTYGEDGELYFSGRMDFQIKHMGHRIELEEIESVLNRLDGLEKSCCVMDAVKNQIVVFYYGDAMPGEIKRKLRGYLPVYMVPHRLVQVDHIMLNKNGKTDREYYRSRLEVGQ